GAGPRRRHHRPVLRRGGDRRPRQPARRRARRADRGRRALALRALPAAGRALRHLLRDGDGARLPAARSFQPGRTEEDLRRDRTVALVGAVLAALLAGGALLPQWAMFIVTI